VRVFATKEHPLVLFLDDLQWADSASLDLQKLLMDESEAGYLLILGAYRDNEVFAAHPLMLTLDELQKQGATLNTIALAPLNETDITRLVADTLLCSADVAVPLSQLVYQKAKGNPFFTTQFLQGLYEEGCITFEGNARYWQCDLTQVRQLVLTNDVVVFMVGRLQKLPEATQEVLKLAACIGNRFDLSTLAVVCERSQDDIASDLWQALQEGFLVPESETYKFFQEVDRNVEEIDRVTVGYRFLHDRVQQAAYALIGENRKQATHLKIGRQLWHNLSDSEREEYLFTIVNHLNAGGELILDRAEREQIARLNLQASHKAKSSVAYEASRRYCHAGQRFLNETSWEDNYSLQFELAIASIEAEYLNCNLQAAKVISDETLNKVRTLLDRVKVHELQILFEINQNRMNEAISLALDVLRLLGIDLSSEPQEIQQEIQLLRQEIALPNEEISSLTTLKAVEDEEKLAAIRILTNANSAAYIANPTIYPAIVLHTVRYCMKYGNSPLATSAYSWYGALLCGVYEEFEAGYEFGKLSLQLLEQFNARALTAKVSNMFNVFVRPWKEPLRNAVEVLPAAIQGGFDNGDVEYAFYAAVHYCNYLFYSGSSLDSVYQAQERYLPSIVKAQYEFHEGFLRINQQAVANLLGETYKPQDLQGSILDGEKCLSRWLENNIVFLVLCFYEAQTRLAYLFEDNVRAVEAAENGWQYRQAATGTLYVSEHNFYYSLALLASETRTPKQLDRIAENQIQLKTWAQFSPTNFQHKYDLVEAERHRWLGQYMEALELFDRAIAGAKENGYVHEEALANELVAKLYLGWGKEKAAAGYMQEAYYGYARWGAKAKTEHLEQTYPQLLTPILQHSESLLPFNPIETSTSNIVTVTTQISFLDLTSAIKASRAISEEIERDALLSKLMQVVLENAGADAGALVLNHSGTWKIAAQYANKTCHLSDTILETSDTLPHSILNTVKRTQQTLIVDRVERDRTFAGDSYFLQKPPKSLLCTPILNQGKLIGILYLENQLTAGVFTPARIEVLKLLTAQAAISLENARLYSCLEDYSHNLEFQVEQRTEELQEKNQHLQQALQELQQTQTHLIQAEKMSSLGQMVAGIAHEINNPINFIAGNIDLAREYVCDLLDLLQLYEQNGASHPSVQMKVQSIDLDFLCDDLSKLLDSMKNGSNRIRQIILGLRNFSRLDESAVKEVDLHEGLENTLLILQHRLKATGKRSEIDIVKHYGQLPLINCYASQLNQVFLNILTNAIDVLATSEAVNSPQIQIATEMRDRQTARIRIVDNGPGMSESIRQRIFDPFFTTKPVGRGTGLGLSISYQIVTEQHRGQLQCISQLGTGTEFTIDLPASV
ncbi:MAG: GAF domain-containing protein, partial [Cyanobacteria bacterium SID2]|nr:GAF domain-containing protein [Cyanobacteria bacterium SID2]